jgi:hypothetical protein
MCSFTRVGLSFSTVLVTMPVRSPHVRPHACASVW